MIIIKKPEEIAIMREGGEILVKVLKEVQKKITPGVETAQLNKLAEKLVYKNKAKPSFKNFLPTSYQGRRYPASLCTSVNEEVVHGIPSNRELKEGDIIGLDLGICFKNFYTDATITVPVGEVKKEVQELINTTKKALYLSVFKIKPKNRIGDISSVIQETIESAGFSVVRDCVGHGVGKFVHEEPSVPNFGKPHTGIILQKGMTLAIEPMANLKGYKVEIEKDGWTIKTCDRSLSCHFEWTVVVTENGYEVLTLI
jgi:methionyl aminopeptidase